MSAFVLLRENDGADSDTALRAACQTLSEQGFAEAQEFKTATWRVVAYPSLNGVPPAIVRAEADCFALAFGTLFYGDETGPAALDALRKALRGGSVAWSQLGGTFCVIACDRGELQLITDAVGQYKVYRDPAWNVVSSSFLAVLATSAARTPCVQGIYQYVFEGATFGEHTVVKEVCQLEGPVRVRLRDRVAVEPADIEIPRSYSDAPRERHVEEIGELLDRRFGAIAKHYAGHIATALSGGFDSRLILAQLRRAGVVPDLHVYGSPQDADVRVAKLIAAGEQLQLVHVDKESPKNAERGTREQVVANNFLAFDGWPVDGIFDAGADVATRRQRARSGKIALNGGGGEIFRNFFYMPDRPFSAQQLLWTFYSQFDAKCCTGAFRLPEYYESLSEALYRSLRIDAPRRLSRAEIELAYPFYRCRFWTGRNTSVNLRFGHSLTPFLELDLILRAAEVPLRYKNYGALEASLIERADPALAGYTSAYGHAFDKPMRWRTRWRYALETARPPSLRRLSFRLKRALRPPPTPAALDATGLNDVVDMRLPAMGAFFDVRRVHDPHQLARIYSLEYLFAWHWRSQSWRVSSANVA